MVIIALQGKPGAGKGVVANYLCTRHGYLLHKIAKPLKDMLRYGFGLTERHIEGDLKEVPCEQLGGKTPRYAMQTLGKEWKELMHPDLFLLAWKATLPSVHPRIVVDDNRYPNEIPFLRELGALFVRVERPTHDLVDAGAHPAEHQVLPFDVVLHNVGTIADLEQQVLDVLLNNFDCTR